MTPKEKAALERNPYDPNGKATMHAGFNRGFAEGCTYQEQVDREVIENLVESLMSVMPYLQASFDSPEAVSAVFIPQAERFRRIAKQIEEKDTAILKAREALSAYHKATGQAEKE